MAIHHTTSQVSPSIFHPFPRVDFSEKVVQYNRQDNSETLVGVHGQIQNQVREVRVVDGI